MRTRTRLFLTLTLATVGAAAGACVIPTENMATTTVTSHVTETEAQPTTVRATVSESAAETEHTTTATITSWALRDPGKPPPEGDWEEMGPYPSDKECERFVKAMTNDGRATTGCELRDGRWWFYLGAQTAPTESEPEETPEGH